MTSSNKPTSEQPKAPKILFLVNVDRFFLSHRLPIALYMKEKGYEVFVACDNTGYKDRIIRNGLRYIETRIDGTNTKLFRNLATLWSIIRIYGGYDFEIIHNVTMKPVLYGSFAARLHRKQKVVNAISGFGHLFTGNRSQSKLGSIIRLMIKQAFSWPGMKFIVQNMDDQQLLIQQFEVPLPAITLIKGSGVDLEKIQYTPPKAEGKVQLLLHARMIYEKGVREFYEMACILKAQYGDAIACVLYGGLDPNIHAVSETVLQQWNEEGVVTWMGYTEQIFEVIAASDIIVFPSYYREGLPKSLIDATAVGRPIITYNLTGNRECVVHGENGFFAEPKNVEDLVKYARILIDDPELRIRMGRASRTLCEKNFDIKSVVQKTEGVYQSFN